MDELASPIAAFLRDRCVIEPDATCPVPAMYESWRSWCHEHGRGAVGDEHSFGRDLHAAIPALATIRPRTPLGRVRHYTGIRLRTATRLRRRQGPGRIHPFLERSGRCFFLAVDKSFEQLLKRLAVETAGRDPRPAVFSGHRVAAQPQVSRSSDQDLIDEGRVVATIRVQTNECQGVRAG